MRNLIEMILMSVLMAGIYIAIWKTTGFEYAVCCGIGQTIASIVLKN